MKTEQSNITIYKIVMENLWKYMDLLIGGFGVDGVGFLFPKMYS